MCHDRTRPRGYTAITVRQASVFSPPPRLYSRTLIYRREFYANIVHTTWRPAGRYRRGRTGHVHSSAVSTTLERKNSPVYGWSVVIRSVDLMVSYEEGLVTRAFHGPPSDGMRVASGKMTCTTAAWQRDDRVAYWSRHPDDRFVCRVGAPSSSRVYTM